MCYNRSNLTKQRIKMKNLTTTEIKILQTIHTELLDTIKDAHAQTGAKEYCESSEDLYYGITLKNQVVIFNKLNLMENVEQLFYVVPFKTNNNDVKVKIKFKDLKNGLAWLKNKGGVMVDAKYLNEKLHLKNI